MWHALFLLFFIFTPFNLYAKSSDNIIYHAEDDSGKLPSSVTTLLKKVSPDTAIDCGFFGKEVFISDDPNGFKYYAIRPAKSLCVGSGGTTLWIASVKNKNATLLIEDGGFQIKQLEKVNFRLHNLKFTGGSLNDFQAKEWSYDGAKYNLVNKKFFVPDDCKDPIKSKDEDFPWECTS